MPFFYSGAQENEVTFAEITDCVVKSTIYVNKSENYVLKDKILTKTS